MKNLITNMVMIMLLFFAVGCGEGSSTKSTPTENEATGVRVNVSVDKSKETIYQKDSVEISSVLLEVWEVGVGLVDTFVDNTPAGGFHFSVSGLTIGIEYEFTLYAYNSSGTQISESYARKTVTLGMVIEMPLTQVDGLDITSEAFAVTDLDITHNGDDTSDVLFTLSNPDSLSYHYILEDSDGTTILNGDAFGLTFIIPNLTNDTYYLTIINDYFETLTMYFTIEDGVIVNVAEAPSITGLDLNLNASDLDGVLWILNSPTHLIVEYTLVEDDSIIPVNLTINLPHFSIDNYDGDSDFTIKARATDEESGAYSERIFHIVGNPI